VTAAQQRSFHWASHRASKRAGKGLGRGVLGWHANEQEILNPLFDARGRGSFQGKRVKKREGLILFQKEPDRREGIEI